MYISIPDLISICNVCCYNETLPIEHQTLKKTIHHQGIFRGRKSTSNPIKNSNITNHQSQLVLSSKENQSSDDFENKCNRASHATVKSFGRIRGIKVLITSRTC